MKLFIDTGFKEEIQEARELGILDGVTTNPSLMAKARITGEEAVHNHYKEICNITEGPVSAEVIGTEYDDIIREGKTLSALDDNIIVKVPMSKDGIKAIRYFSAEGIHTNCTLVFSSAQALLAAKAGASYVSPFIGRLDDIGHDGVELIREIITIYNNYGFETKILAASIRHTNHIIKCAEAGADIVTCPLNVIEGLFNHPLTNIGLEKFLNDHKKANS